MYTRRLQKLGETYAGRERERKRERAIVTQEAHQGNGSPVIPGHGARAAVCSIRKIRAAPLSLCVYLGSPISPPPQSARNI